MYEMVSKEALNDLKEVKNKFDTIVESLELINNKKFMNSYGKAKKQVKQREFDDWEKI